MKILCIFFAVAVGLCATSCHSDPVDEPTPPPTDTELSIVLPENILTDELGAEGISFDVNVSSTDSWVAESSAAWCTVTPDFAEKGDCMVSLTFAANPSGKSREVSVSFKGISRKEILIFRQKARTLSLDQESFSVGYSGGEIEVKIMSNVPEDIRLHISSDFVNYLSAKENIYTFLVTGNPDEISRVGNITVSSGDLIKQITIKQEGMPRIPIGGGDLPVIPTVPVDPF